MRARTVLGPTPCHGCRTIVRWLRLFDGSLLLVNANGRGTDGSVHECRWVKRAAA